MSLNEFGLIIWYHKQIPNICIERSYSWVNRALMIDENSGGRLVIGEVDPREFDFSQWEQLTKAQYDAKIAKRFVCQACTPTKTCDDCKWPYC